MKRLGEAVIACLMISCSMSVLSYEIPTHEYLSTTATTISAPLIDKRLRDLGWTSLTDTATLLIAQYGVPTPGWTKTLSEWIAYGARREDDHPRYINHFFNPLNGQSLTPCPPPFPTLGMPCHSSPDWALEDGGVYFSQLTSLRDANQYFYDALTTSDPSDRNHLMASTFYALGHVIHHLQDMAQPQHVRNEQHPVSLYEKYIDELRQSGQLLVGSYPSVYDETNTQNISHARSFWHDSVTWEGMADFTNREFISQGTNFRFSPPGIIVGPPEFPSPVPSASPPASACNDPVIAALYPGYGCEMLPFVFQPVIGSPVGGFGGNLTFFSTAVTDSRYPTTGGLNRWASTLSIFSDFGSNNPSMPVRPLLHFSVNRFTFESSYPFLLNRAVAYSAGLLNYFFRGSIEATIDSNGVLEIRNTSAHFAKGEFRVFYDDSMGNRHLVPGAVYSMYSTAIGPGQSIKGLGFAPPSNPIRYIVTFRGYIGAEEGIAGTIAVIEWAKVWDDWIGYEGGVRCRDQRFERGPERIFIYRCTEVPPGGQSLGINFFPTPAIEASDVVVLPSPDSSSYNFAEINLFYQNGKPSVNISIPKLNFSTSI